MEIKFLRNTPFFTKKKEWRNFWRLESIISWGEAKMIQIELATTCNKREQQQDGKYNYEL